jgi:hypothetical protein
MEIVTEQRGVVIASDSGISIGSFNDISGVVGACLGAGGLILAADNLSPDFFNLSSGLAGELFQKLVNYNVRTAIILPDLDAHGERFKELAYEHSTHSLIRFFRSRDDANAWFRA